MKHNIFDKSLETHWTPRYKFWKFTNTAQSTLKNRHILTKSRGSR